MQTVNEGSSAWLTVSFKDKNGALAAPTAVHYRVDCVTTRTSVRPLTPIPGSLAGTLEIALAPEDTAIRNASNPTEVKRVTVVAQYGGSTDQVTDEYDYAVKNLRYYG